MIYVLLASLVIGIIYCFWSLLAPVPQSLCSIAPNTRRKECECSDCMEPGLRGPDTSSVSRCYETDCCCYRRHPSDNDRD
jgi:hypothetical protein